jgi:hypothetical protein
MRQAFGFLAEVRSSVSSKRAGTTNHINYKHIGQAKFHPNLLKMESLNFWHDQITCRAQLQDRV